MTQRGSTLANAWPIQDLLEDLPDAVVVVDERGRIVYVNLQTERLTGYRRRELVGGPIERLVPARLRMIHQKHRLMYASRPRPRPMGSVDHDFQLRRKDGSELAVDIALGPIGRPRDGHVAAVIRDITERRRLEADLEHRALHDPLTGLANRTLFFDRLQQAMLQVGRDRQPVALVMLDLDRFKAVNDALGHVAGDAILRQLGVQLQSGLRSTDTVARIGGDEFAWILPHVGGRDAAARKARVLLRSVSGTYAFEANEIEVGISAGMAFYPDDGHDADSLLRHADLALYTAKRQGGGLALLDWPARVATPVTPRSRRRTR